LFDALFVTSNPIPIKMALNLTGFNVGGYRLPLIEPSQQIIEIIKKSLSEI